MNNTINVKLNQVKINKNFELNCKFPYYLIWELCC